jgi:glycosyltransferase involved in cell wall biosynthesis
VHLIALVESPDHVCARYRLAAFAPGLESAGHTLELRAMPRTPWGKFALGGDLRRADVVIVQRKLLPRWQLALLRRRVPRLLFDFDDAVWLRDSYAGRGPLSGRRERRFAAMLRSADAVVAGNAFLRAAALRWAPSERIAVIPTCVDPSRYPMAEHVRATEGVQLVWVGSSSTLQGLEQVRRMLDGLGLAHPGLHLKLICDRFLALPNLPVVPCRWSEADELEQIAAADVGISWVPDDAWSRGKCGLKVLQYMAAGLPVVANPVGVQAEMVRPGETGYLAETPEQWSDAVGRLAADPVLRARLGRNGRALVEARFGCERGAALWNELLSERFEEREAG